MRNIGVLWLVSAGCAFIASCQTTRFSALSTEAGSESVRVLRQDPIAVHTVAFIDPDPTVGQFCSGTVIGQRQILTAAACFDDMQKIPYVLFESSDDPGREGEERTQLVRVARVAVHASYSAEARRSYEQLLRNQSAAAGVALPDAPLNDLAVVYLEEGPGVIEAYKPVALAAAPAAEAHVGQLFAAGYGCRLETCDESQTELHKVPMRFVRNFAEAHRVHLAGGARRGSCVGDSGGPEFQIGNGGIAQFAVMTSGPENCEKGLAIDTLVEPHRQWIATAVAHLQDRTWKDAEFRIIDFADDLSDVKD